MGVEGRFFFGEGVMGGRADRCGVTFFFGALFFRNWTDEFYENETVKLLNPYSGVKK